MAQEICTIISHTDFQKEQHNLNITARTVVNLYILNANLKCMEQTT